MITTSSLLARAFDLSWPQYDAEPADHCALCGADGIPVGVPLKRVIRGTTSEIADTFRYGGAYACIDCAACFAQPKLLVGNLLAIDGPDPAGIKPVVARDNATPERPAWRDIITSLAIGTSCAAIITTNAKRRLWPMVPVSTFGPLWRPLYVDGNVARVLTVDAAALRGCLSLIEEVYTQGYSKRAIGTSLLSGITVKAFTESAAQIMQYEAALQQRRGTDEFLLALFIAQKESTT